MTAMQLMVFFTILTSFCTGIHMVMQLLYRARIPLTSTPAIQTVTALFVWTRAMYPVAALAMIGFVCVIDPNWLAAVISIGIVLYITHLSFQVKLVRVKKTES